jgi:hypothetical protein
MAVKPQMKAPENTHFSVKYSCAIGGMQFRPSICYLIPASLTAVLEEQAKAGLVRLYTQEVRFVSGVARPFKG